LHQRKRGEPLRIGFALTGLVLSFLAAWAWLILGEALRISSFSRPRNILKKYRACLALIALLSPSSRATDKHAFGVDDWTGLRSARVVAVSPNGHNILYSAGSGVAKGSTNEEYWLVAPDGTAPHKLIVPQGFSPFGFTRDGLALYGSFDEKEIKQLATVPLAAPLENLKVLTSLPSGIAAAVISPDGTRFAVIASQRPPTRSLRFTPSFRIRNPASMSSALPAGGAHGGAPRSRISRDWIGRPTARASRWSRRRL
jgi:hypothetical protein